MHTGLHSLRRGLKYGVEHYLRPHLLKRSIRHVSGMEDIACGPDEVLAVCVVRDGALHVRTFIEHHIRLGVRHIVLLDNGSTDETVAIAQEYDRITVLRSDCPYRTYENVMKRYLVRRFALNRWVLCVDIDELFDYPFSSVLKLRSLVGYLRQHSYTAVVAQMLDMLPDTTLAKLPRMSSRQSPQESCRYYDISNIRKLNYPWGTLPDIPIRRHHGGIRDTLFGTDNGLTKAALFFVDQAIELFVSWHHMNHVRIADFTAVLLHYPFVASFPQKVCDAVETGRYGHHTIQYERYWEGLQTQLERRMIGDTAQKLHSIEELLDNGFLVASPAFRQWAAQSCRSNPAH